MSPRDFPLFWPDGKPRTETRIPGRFSISFVRAYDQLLDQVEKLNDAKDRDVIVSANVPLGKNKMPVKAAAGKLLDPGVCVYFWMCGKPYALPCDTYLEVRHNLRALWYTIHAYQMIRRHATPGLLEQSMIGFCRELETVERPAVKLLSVGRS